MILKILNKFALNESTSNLTSGQLLIPLGIIYDRYVPAVVCDPSISRVL
jgi:hypothetical protein